MDLATAAQRFHGFRWIEDQLFEVLGSWVPTVPEATLKEHLAVACQRHAWHAELWEQRIPAVPGLGGPAAVGWAPAFMAALAAPGADETLERLVGVYRVLLPRLVRSYQALLDALDARVDGPTVRILRLVLHDEVEACRDGEQLVQSLLTTPAEVARAVAHRARLEALVESGPF